MIRIFGIALVIISFLVLIFQKNPTVVSALKLKHPLNTWILVIAMILGCIVFLFGETKTEDTYTVNDTLEEYHNTVNSEEDDVIHPEMKVEVNKGSENKNKNTKPVNFSEANQDQNNAVSNETEIESIKDTEPNIISESQTSTDTDSQESKLLIMEDGLELTFLCDKRTVNTHNVVFSIIEENYDIRYIDSFIEIGNKDSIHALYELNEYHIDDIKEYETESGSTLCVAFKEDDNLCVNRALILQDIGSEDYLCIEIKDYTKRMSEKEIIDMAAIHF